jgi:hypothetical protein
MPPESSTSTATTTTTTTTTTTPLPDCSSYCYNGGTSYLAGGACHCKCTTEYQGETCKHKKDEAAVGVLVSLYPATIPVWNSFWALIESIVVDAVNEFCKDNVKYCCVEAPVDQVSYSAPNYLNSISVGTGYPIEIPPDEVQALLYASLDTTTENLCDYVKTLTKRRRRKRQVDVSSGLTLSQDTLQTAIASVQSNLTAAAESVGSGVKSISLGTVESENENAANTRGHISLLLLGLAFTTWAFLKELLTTNL